ncbi:MAG: hypothetical protein K0S37_4796 [Microbacterium sp.]|nr:hypothetical protein [Microbacterium sp.]
MTALPPPPNGVQKVAIIFAAIVSSWAALALAASVLNHLNH